MSTILDAGNVWALWAIIAGGVAASIYLEQTYRWAAKMTGPMLALILAMALSNTGVMPTDSPVYDIVDGYFVPIAIPLLLFQANLLRIVRETGSLFIAFHVSALGTVLGAFLAAFIFSGRVEQVPEIAGIMTASYIGGGVNFVAVKNSFQVSSEVANPLIVADNFIMAGIFAVLLVMSGSRFFLSRFAHPHTIGADSEGAGTLAAKYWKRKEIGLLDIAKALGLAVVIAAVAMNGSAWVRTQIAGSLSQALLGNAFVWITVLTVIISTIWHRRVAEIHGAQELGGFLLYFFFFVIGLRADLIEVIQNVPVLFLFCLVMALTNLGLSLLLGFFLRLNLEEVLVAVNATLGGAPSAAAMAVAKGWSDLVLPGLLVGIWGYVIGTFLGILTGELLR